MADTLPLRTPAEPQPPAVAPEAGALPPLLLDTADLCRVLRISKATLHRLLAAGKLPKPIKLAGLKWPAAEIEAFVALGCPPREEFEARRDAEKRNGRPV